MADTLNVKGDAPSDMKALEADLLELDIAERNHLEEEFLDYKSENVHCDVPV